MGHEESLTILYIDDNTVTNDLDRAGYRKAGVFLKPVNSFQKAADALNVGGIDIILINKDYSGIDALALVTHFKADHSTKHIPVVVTSVQDKPKDVGQLIEKGLDLFVEQPMPRQYFIEKLRHLLDQQIREESRVPLETRVEFRLGGQDGSCHIGDISVSGLLLLYTSDMALESPIELSFQLPGEKKPILVHGTVVREIIKPAGGVRVGFGVRFGEFSGDSKKRLDLYLASASGEDPELAYYL